MASQTDNEAYQKNLLKMLDEAGDEVIDPNNERPLSEEQILGTGPRRSDIGATQATEHRRDQPSSKMGTKQTAAQDKKPKDTKPTPTKTTDDVKKLAKLIGNIRNLAAATAAVVANSEIIIGALIAVALVIIIMVMYPLIEGSVSAVLRGLMGGSVAQTATHQQDDTRVRDLLAATGNVNAIRDAITTSARTAKQKLAELKEGIQPSDPNKQPTIQVPADKKAQILEQLAVTRNAVENLLAAINVEAQQPKPKPGENNQESTPKKSRVPGLRTIALTELNKLSSLLSGADCSGLPATNDSALIQLPSNSAYTMVNPHGGGGNDMEHKWATRKLACFLITVGNRLNADKGLTLEIGDLSNRSGTQYPGHQTHVDGEHADIYVETLLFPGSASYKRENAIWLAKLMWDSGACDVIFNDPTMLGTRYEGVTPHHLNPSGNLSRRVANHENHWHIQVCN